MGSPGGNIAMDSFHRGPWSYTVAFPFLKQEKNSLSLLESRGNWSLCLLTENKESELAYPILYLTKV